MKICVWQGETLKVVMAPQRTRTTISFEQRPTAGAGDNTLPRLTLFEHVAGARVLQDLFPYYRLPNGKKAYYYYDAGKPFLHPCPREGQGERSRLRARPRPCHLLLHTTACPQPLPPCPLQYPVSQPCPFNSCFSPITLPLPSTLPLPFIPSLVFMRCMVALWTVPLAAASCSHNRGTQHLCCLGRDGAAA